MKIALLFTTLLLIASCSKKVTTVELPTGEIPPIPLEADGPIVDFADEPQPTTPMTVEKKTVVVYFDFDSYELKKSEEWKISNIDRPVELVGGTCPVGDESYNYTLGMHRAVAVRDYIEGNGGKVTSCKSFGENNLASEDKNEYHKNRRCEIRY